MSKKTIEKNLMRSQVFHEQELYQYLPCPICREKTQHILCLSNEKGNKQNTVYACMECGNENSKVVERPVARKRTRQKVQAKES